MWSRRGWPSWVRNRRGRGGRRGGVELKLMKKTADKIEPNWHWGTPEGSREFDRSVDRGMTFRETLEWLEEAETLALQMAAQGSRGAGGISVKQPGNQRG
jgi:hypothetical protein